MAANICKQGIAFLLSRSLAVPSATIDGGGKYVLEGMGEGGGKMALPGCDGEVAEGGVMGITSG